MTGNGQPFSETWLSLGYSSTISLRIMAAEVASSVSPPGSQGSNNVIQKKIEKVRTPDI